MKQQRVFLVPVHGFEHLSDAVGSGFQSDLHPHRILHHILSQVQDAVRHGRREEQRLPGLGGGGDDLLHVVDEAHVEHPVRLVQHETLDVREVDRTAAEVIEKSARCRHENVAAEAQLDRLARDRGPAVNHERLDRRGRSIPMDRGADLLGELAGRRDDQAARVIGMLAGRQTLHDRQTVRCGLPGAGVGRSEHVLSLQGGRNGQALDFRGCRVADLEERIHDRR